MLNYDRGILVTLSGLNHQARLNIGNSYMEGLVKQSMDLRLVQSILLRMVYRFCILYHNPDLFDDLLAEGWLKSIELMETYNERLGMRFPVYMWKGIDFHLRTYCRQYYKWSKALCEPDKFEILGSKTIETSGVFDLDDIPYQQNPEQAYRKQELRGILDNIQQSKEFSKHRILELMSRSSTTFRNRSQRCRIRAKVITRVQEALAGRSSKRVRKMA